MLISVIAFHMQRFSNCYMFGFTSTNTQLAFKRQSTVIALILTRVEHTPAAKINKHFNLHGVSSLNTVTLHKIKDGNMKMQSI